MGVQHKSWSSSLQVPLLTFQVSKSLKEFIYSKKTFTWGEKNLVPSKEKSNLFPPVSKVELLTPMKSFKEVFQICMKKVSL